MTNAELIAKLQKLPQDLEVYDWQYYVIDDPIVRDIEIDDGRGNVTKKTVVFFQ